MTGTPARPRFGLYQHAVHRPDHDPTAQLEDGLALADVKARTPCRCKVNRPLCQMPKLAIALPTPITMPLPCHFHAISMPFPCHFHASKRPA